ncbi:MAG: gliding motility-associated C-terminal domain-containing protein [Paludibacteraceae bacterium]|nr:gliding motility-associated C-terminal domain-containing protein [Paludibacteraceae bacterium]
MKCFSRCLLCLLLAFSSTVIAEELVSIESTGTAVYTLKGQEGVRCVYICERLNAVSFQTSKPAYWYEYTDTNNPIGGTTHTLFQRLDDAMTYIIDVEGKRDTIVVFDYQKYRIGGKRLTTDLQCEQSLLHLDIEPMTYYEPSGRSHTLQRTFTALYHTLKRDSTEWTEADWEDTLTVTRPSTISLHHTLYLPTQIELRGDRFAEELYGTEDMLMLMADEVHPIAIGYIPKSYTALRGTDPEDNNERDRIMREDGLTGSAPLNVLFRANATPTAEMFLWEIKRSDNIIASRTENETRYLFNETGNYTVHLHVSNTHDCECDTTFKIEAKESYLAVPNVFTPNGDGINDEFRVAYRSLKSFSCLIFNRWQHQIYSFNDPAQGWNGRVNGRPAPEGAYYYIIEAVGTDGAKYKRKGAVNLIRGKK